MKFNNSDGTEALKAYLQELKQYQIPVENFVELIGFSDDQWKDVISFGSGDFYPVNGALHLPESWKYVADKIPLQAKMLWWLAWLGVSNLDDTTLMHIIDRVFDTIELNLNVEIVTFFISLLAASKSGIRESDIIALFKESKVVEDSSVSRIWCKFCWLMGPILSQENVIKIMDKQVLKKAIQRYGKKLMNSHRKLATYFEKQNLYLSDEKGKYKCCNTQKLSQLPYQTFMINMNQNETDSLINSIYLTDLQWIQEKINTTGCASLLNDIYLVEEYLEGKNAFTNKIIHLHLLKDCIQKYILELNYDSSQFCAILGPFIQENYPNMDNDNKIIKKWLHNPQNTYLEKLNIEHIEKNCDNAHPAHFNILINLGCKGYFVASVSTEGEEICVWDVSTCRRVRTLRGIPQPTSLCPVGEYGAAVLCRREIKVIDLNEGIYKVTLKGVMNQKMPYFGLHDSKHLVCLSRNRMYVNLMNLESGDCVTTFKAGEDRFLNSLLVSGDGRILVCGDETQKPFPLLVWHLSQRKLLYDLRIPHHDFITSLSAITYEGSYVCVVAKELNEPTPNFIVVYDLQSGTLFKKWKPICNTVSLAISQANTCVVAGLEDARILIWDLVTGNCRCTLIGHNAPVTLLKLDPMGKILLSGDKTGQDMSIRLWELISGRHLAVYTPPTKILTCEILPNGKYIVLALENHSVLTALILKNYFIEENTNCNTDKNFVFGDPKLDGKVFDLKI